MRILFANYRYFVSSGSERYMFNATKALLARGHEVLPFSISYNRNVQTPFSRHFVPPPGSSDAVYFRDQSLTLSTLLRTLERSVYSREVERSVRSMIAETSPDIAYVLNYLRKLSPSLLVGIKKQGLPIAVRLSDYVMMCPEGHCSRNAAPCTLCVHGNLWPSIRHRCVQGSLAASGLNALATWFHRLMRYFDLIDVFVVPSRFMYDMMRKAGFASDRLRLIPSFVDTSLFRPPDFETRGRYIAYAGRMHPTKGLHVVLDALTILRKIRPDLELRFRIAGTGDRRYLALLRDEIARRHLQKNVELMGELATAELCRFLQNAQFSIVPSLYYENLPNAVLESYACGTPVLASNIGSLSECVTDEVTGWLFQPGDPKSLAHRLASILDHPEEVREISRRLPSLVASAYAPQAHVELLEGMFSDLTSGP